jgi:general secretion pathway protein G
MILHDRYYGKRPAFTQAELIVADRRARDFANKVLRPAFTLMEIIVVVAIILILAGAGAVVLPRFLSDAKVSKAKLDIKSLETVLMKYNLDNNHFPQTLFELTQIPPTGGLAYMEDSLLNDPWGQPWDYNPSVINPRNGKPRIGTQGPPGQNQPVYNWTQ